MSLPEKDRAWLFERGTWSEVVEDIYSRVGEEDQPDLSTAFRQGGYTETPIMRLGSIERGFGVEVYEAERGIGAAGARTPYLINVMVGSAVECIYVADFPSLMTLMNQFSTIARGVVSVG
jgi:hypothetical protein